MMGDASPIGGESGGFDDVEFDHWMRVAQARLDAELRQLVSRAAAGLELDAASAGGNRVRRFGIARGGVAGGTRGAAADGLR